MSICVGTCIQTLDLHKVGDRRSPAFILRSGDRRSPVFMLHKIGDRRSPAFILRSGDIRSLAFNFAISVHVAISVHAIGCSC